MELLPLCTLVFLRTFNLILEIDHADVSRLITLFLYMVAELSALQQIINALTGLDGLPALVVEAVVTAIYTGKSITRSPRTPCSNCQSLWRVPHIFHHGQHPGRYGGWADHYRRGHSRRRDSH